VLDELLGGKAVDGIAVATGALGEIGKDLFPVLACIRPPLAGWIDHVGLDT
jgi:hypothetical protein